MPISEKLQALIDRLSANDQKLISVNLDGYQLGDEDAIAIASALENNTQLIAINLSNNRISNIGAAAISAALVKNHKLLILYLGCNLIESEGAKIFATTLEKNGMLNVLDLSDNGIGTEGAQAFAAAFRINRTLTTIILSHNPIGDIGAAAIVEALEENSTLMSVNLAYCGVNLCGSKTGSIGALALKKIDSIISRNKKTYGKTYPLHTAIRFAEERKREGMVLALLKKGLDPTSIDASGISVLQAAQIVGDTKIVTILQRYLEAREKCASEVCECVEIERIKKERLAYEAEEGLWQKKALQLEMQIKNADSQLEILQQRNIELIAQLSSGNVLRLSVPEQEQLKAKLAQDLLINGQQIYIKSKPALSKYYDTLRLCMTRFCAGAFSIASGFVAREEGIGETIGKGIITYILPGIGKIITFSATAYLRRQKVERLREFSHIATSFGGADECIEETARVLTLAQEDDLIAISEAKPSSSVRAKVGRFFQAAKDWALSEDCPAGIERKAKEDALELMGRFIDAIEAKRKISHLAGLLIDEKAVEEILQKRYLEPTSLSAPTSASEVAAVVPVSTPVDAVEVVELRTRVTNQDQAIERMTKQLQEALKMGKDVKTIKELMTSLGFSTSGDGPLVQLSSSDFAHDDLTLIQRLLRMITARDDFINALASELAQLKEQVGLRS